jgi:hypothetical protein
LVFLALAFVPFVAPLFGRAVVPWMAYRALWGVPFALLLAGGLSRVGHALAGSSCASRSRHGAIAIVVLLAALGLNALPWTRLRESETRLAPDAATLTLLDTIGALPQNSVIAAAPGLSELIPAYGGRAVLAFADRGTAAFSARRGEAERRLRANAAVIALHGHARRARRDLLAAHHVTHVVLERITCERGTHPVYADGRFTICEVRAGSAGAKRRVAQAKADAYWMPQQSSNDAAPRGKVLATLSNGIACAPGPTPVRNHQQWRREHRWSGRFTTVDCTATFSAPTSIASVTLRGALPHAREALVYTAASVGPGGRCGRSGAVELIRDRSADIPLACEYVSVVRFRFASAYLPYISLRTLEIRGPES